MLVNMSVKEEKHELDLRVRRTRQLLQQALTALWSERGFQAVTVQDIAERAMVNRSTFYAHFEDKYALLEYTIRERFKEALHQKLPEGSPFSPDNLKILLKAICEFVAQLQHSCSPADRQFHTLVEKQIKTQLYEIFLAWFVQVNNYPFGANVSTESLAMMTSWAVYGAALEWNQRSPSQPVELFVQQVFPVILHNFGQPVGV